MKNEIFSKLGITREDVLKHYDNIDQLRTTYPGMVIAKATRDFKYSINTIKKQEFKKDQSKVLNLFIYERLEYDKNGNLYLEPSEKIFKQLYNPYTGQDLSGKTLLVWRTGGIGDLLFIQPNLIYLKEKYPDCKIIFSCSPCYADLINTWKCIDAFAYLPFDLDIFENADYHCTFEGVIERCKEAEYTNAYKLFSKWMGLDLPDEKLHPVQTTKKSINIKVLKILNENFGIKKYDYITAQVRTSSPVRTPSIKTWKYLFEPLLNQGHNIIITDKPALHNQIDDFIKTVIHSDLRSRIFNFSKYSTTIDMSVSLVNFSKLTIAPDSSMVHIAASLQVPVMGIYGPFPGNIRMSLYKNSDWIEPDKSEVCSFNGHHCCIHSHTPCPSNEQSISPCFDKIDFVEAHKKIQNLLTIRGNCNG